MKLVPPQIRTARSDQESGPAGGPRSRGGGEAAKETKRKGAGAGEEGEEGGGIQELVKK